MSRARDRIARSKRLGERTEATIIQRVDGLAPASDRDAHHDAVAERTISPDQVPMGGTPLVERGTPIEIKSAAVVVGEAERRGRWYLRRRQHEALLDSAGAYLLAVTTPDPDREPLARLLAPASIVDEHVPGWIDRPSRSARGKVVWSRLIDPEQVRRDGGGRA